MIGTALLITLMFGMFGMNMLHEGYKGTGFMALGAVALVWFIALSQ